MRPHERIDDPRSGDGAGQDDGGAGGKRHQHAHHQGIDVMQGQGHKHPVLGPDDVQAQQGADIGGDIGAGQIEALGRAGGARGIDPGRHLWRN